MDRLEDPILTKEERNTRSDPWLSYVSLWTQFAVLFLTFPLLGSVPMNSPIQCRNCGNMVSFSRSIVPYKEDCSLYYLIEIGKNGIALNAELYRYCNARKETLSCKDLFGITCCWNWRIARAEQIARNTDVTTALILTPFLKALRNGVRRYADILSGSTTVINFSALFKTRNGMKWLLIRISRITTSIMGTMITMFPFLPVRLRVGVLPGVEEEHGLTRITVPRIWIFGIWVCRR